LAFVWSEEAIERLKALHAQGLSGAGLASRLGCGLTRSAVFGKLHRLGLTGRKNESERRPSPLRSYNETRPCDHGGSDRGTEVHGKGPMRFNFARKGGRSRRANAARDLVIPVLPLPSLRIGIVEIGKDQCRFIEGDDGLACGHPVARGSRWCPAHHAMVFVEEA
jgi:hypothetical protein